MVKAYVLVKTVAGTEDRVLRSFHEIQSIEEAHKVFGPYDIVIEVRGRDMESVVDIVTGKIRTVEGVFDTQTLLVIDVDLDLSQSSLAS
ncbi:MAG: Lrp/AsnC ligand binding domain-containing protein [Candidatus Thorarchaeota archaeon]